MLCSCFRMWSSSFQMLRASTFWDGSAVVLQEGCVLLGRAIHVRLGYKYIVARSRPADSHLLANLHLRRHVCEYEIVIAQRFIGDFAKVAEECRQDGWDAELHCNVFS